MNKFRLIFGLSFILLNAKSQSVFPTFSDNSKWSVLECEMTTGCQTFTYSFSYDTTFCGHTYSVVDSLYNFKRGYFRSDSTKTYFRKSSNCSDKEYLVYDYSVSVGDTIWVGYNIFFMSVDTSQYLVDSIQVITYDGIPRKRIKLLYDPCGSSGTFARPMYWIEGIGSDIHPFYPFYCLCDGCETSYSTLCYDSSSVQLYINNYFNTCDTTITTGIEDYNVKNQFQLFPNPTSDQINIRIEDFQGATNAVLTDVTGKIILQKNILAGNLLNFSVSDLESGIYFVTISNPFFSKTEKIVVQTRN